MCYYGLLCLSLWRVAGLIDIFLEAIEPWCFVLLCFRRMMSCHVPKFIRAAVIRFWMIRAWTFPRRHLYRCMYRI
jgi:hypothetical protein